MNIYNIYMNCVVTTAFFLTKCKSCNLQCNKIWVTCIYAQRLL